MQGERGGGGWGGDLCKSYQRMGWWGGEGWGGGVGMQGVVEGVQGVSDSVSTWAFTRAPACFVEALP